MSRHALPPEERASHAVGLKLTPPEWRLLEAAAEKLKVAPAKLARDALLRYLNPAPIPVPLPIPEPILETIPLTWSQDDLSTWYSVMDLKGSKTDYRHGDKVKIDLEGTGLLVSGSVVGFVSKNLADYWIVKFDKGIYSTQYPYSCAAVVHTMIKTL